MLYWSKTGAHVWKSRRDFEAELVARAWEQPEFKARLLKEPKAVVEELSGEKLPQSLEVVIFEESANRVCLVLPRNPDEELSDQELESVAGGVQLTPGELTRYLDNIFRRF